MAGTIRFDPASWRRAADGFQDSGTQSAHLIAQVVADTSNPAACNAAKGLSTVDGAITMMLEVFGQVMADEVIAPYTEGIDSEVEAMRMTADDYEEIEHENTRAASQVEATIREVQ